jgi:hypothetical protein
MDAKTVKMMIETRLKAAQQNGNTTEASLMFELLKMSQELESMKATQEAQ